MEGNDKLTAFVYSVYSVFPWSTFHLRLMKIYNWLPVETIKGTYNKVMLRGVKGNNILNCYI